MGHPIDFGYIYNNYLYAIRKRIALFINDADVAEDVLQEILLKVCLKLPTYDPIRGSIFAWLNSMVVSTCIDYKRRIKRRRLNEKESQAVSNARDDRLHPERYLIQKELTTLSAHLTPTLYEIVVIIYFRGHTQEEAAAILQLPLGTVKSRQRRALQLMRIHFRDE